MFRCLLILWFFPVAVSAQSVGRATFPEKVWVLAHPFVAKKALRLSRDVVRTVDSLCKTGELKPDLNGGQADAFRHAYWTSTLSVEIGRRKALKLGDAHERGNYRQFRHGRLEDNALPDSLSTEMDLFNNCCGSRMLITERTARIEAVISALHKGELRILSKDLQGQRLDCNGNIVVRRGHEWSVPGCLQASF